MSMGSCDVIRAMLKTIGDYTVVLLIHLHSQFLLQALCYNLSVLQLAPVSPNLH